MEAGEAALARFDLSGVLLVFLETERADALEPRLEALRTYAEFRRVLLVKGHDLPATSLLAIGFTAAQVADFDATIALIGSRSGTGSAVSMCRSQLESIR